MFQIKFLETNTNQIQQLTNFLQNNTTLIQSQWQHVCDKISKTIEDTYIALLIPTLTNLTSKQGGYLLQKLQNLWKRELSTYHTIRKAIKITIQDTNWRIYPHVTNLQNHLYIIIPNPPNDPSIINEWIKILGTIGKKPKGYTRYHNKTNHN